MSVDTPLSHTVEDKEKQRYATEYNYRNDAEGKKMTQSVIARTF